MLDSALFKKITFQLRIFAPYPKQIYKNKMETKNKITKFPKNNIIDETLGNYRANKYGTKSLLFWALLAVLFLLLCSCGSRKVTKSNTEIKEVAKTETTKVDSSKVTVNIDSNTKIVDSSDSEEIIFEPVDNTKPMIVNSKTYLNARISTKKVKANKVTTNDLNVYKTAQNSVKEASKEQSSKEVKAEVKNVDKKQFNFLNLWWLLLLIPIYLLYKRYRGLF